MYKREITLPKNHSFFLFGPRQTGKSTLLKENFSKQESYYYDLLQSSEYLKLKANPSIFRQEILARPPHIKKIIIDEIQKIPILLNEIHSLMSEIPNLIFILTGSNAKKLKTEEANLLAGRALTYFLHPLTTRELPKDILLTDLLRFGSLPPVINQEKTIKSQILQSYVHTYLKEEIEREAQLKKLDSFIQFLRIAAFENGNTLNFSNIGRETGISPKTVQSYFELLQQTMIGFFLYPYLKSQRKRLSKHPKFYFFDTGIVSALQNKLSVDLIPKTQEYGDAFEHFFILEIMRLNDYYHKDLHFTYFRTEKGAEVDLVIETPNQKILALEIKSSDQITNKHIRGLKSFAEDHPEAELYCVSTTARPLQKEKITVLPWRDMLEKIKSL